MAIYSVVFDLLLPQEYEAFFNWLQAYPSKHVTETCYLIETDMCADVLRDNLIPFMGGRDRVFISRVGNDWASMNTHSKPLLTAPGRELP